MRRVVRTREGTIDETPFTKRRPWTRSHGQVGATQSKKIKRLNNIAHSIQWYLMLHWDTPSRSSPFALLSSCLLNRPYAPTTSPLSGPPLFPLPPTILSPSADCKHHSMFGPLSATSPLWPRKTFPALFLHHYKRIKPCPPSSLIPINRRTKEKRRYTKKHKNHTARRGRDSQAFSYASTHGPRHGSKSGRESKRYRNEQENHIIKRC